MTVLQLYFLHLVQRSHNHAVIIFFLQLVQHSHNGVATVFFLQLVQHNHYEVAAIFFTTSTTQSRLGCYYDLQKSINFSR